MPQTPSEPHHGPATRPVEILTAEEVKSLLRACSGRAPTGIRNRALIALGWRGGLRLGEVLALYPKDLDRETGARAMGRMVQEAGRNLERLGVPHAVMGPAVRGDTGTIEEHLRVLAINAPQLVPLYRDLVTLCLPYAIERGMLDSQRAKSISEVLGENTGL